MSAAGRRTTADVMQVAVTTARVAATTGGPLSRSASYRRATALRREGLSFQAQQLPAAPIEEPGPSVHRETAEFAQMPAHPNLDVVTLADTNLLPPDTMGDIGPSQYLVAVNGRVRTLVKATGSADGVTRHFAECVLPIRPPGSANHEPASPLRPARQSLGTCWRSTMPCLISCCWPSATAGP